MQEASLAEYTDETYVAMETQSLVYFHVRSSLKLWLFKFYTENLTSFDTACFDSG